MNKTFDDPAITVGILVNGFEKFLDGAEKL